MTAQNFYRIYYGNKKIRELIRSQFSDVSFAVGSGPALIKKRWAFPVKIVSAGRVDELLDEGLDVYRPALSNSGSFFIFWDLEYFNRKDQSFVYKHQKRVFGWMEPFISRIEEILSSFGIKYILDTTASGFHFWMRISKKSSVFGDLSEEGFLTDSIKLKYRKIVKDDVKRDRPVSLAVARAYDCAGKVLEYLTFKVKEKISGVIPFTVSDAPEFEKNGRRDGFSSDITQYAHPAYMRVFRTIASLHQKNIMFHGGSTPAVDIVRKNGNSMDEVLDCMWDAGRAVSFFSDFNIDLPFSDGGWKKLFEEYKADKTRGFHKAFEDRPAESPVISREPPEIRKFFTRKTANPSLLDPSVLQKIVNHCMESGGLKKLKGMLNIIAGYYDDRSFQWYNPVKFTGIDWTKYDAHQAAHFWGRVYSTQFMLDNG
ncbi:MAG: hypothetical protein ABIJ15_02525 [bacterium]